MSNLTSLAKGSALDIPSAECRVRSAGSRGGPQGKREQNSRSDRHKRIGFFADCAAKKWRFGQPISRAQSAKKRNQLSAVSAQLLGLVE